LIRKVWYQSFPLTINIGTVTPTFSNPVARYISFSKSTPSFLTGWLKQPKEQSINKVGHALHDLDPVFSEFSRATNIKELTRGLLIEEPLLLQSMYIFKQPNIGREVKCHQDSTFLVPHKSLANRSPKSQHAYTLHIISAKSHYASDNWLQRSSESPLRGFD
jgi:Phytanoyl-CoA dioxygenase (PhyH)